MRNVFRSGLKHTLTVRVRGSHARALKKVKQTVSGPPKALQQCSSQMEIQSRSFKSNGRACSCA